MVCWTTTVIVINQWAVLILNESLNHRGGTQAKIRGRSWKEQIKPQEVIMEVQKEMNKASEKRWWHEIVAIFLQQKPGAELVGLLVQYLTKAASVRGLSDGAN